MSGTSPLVPPADDEGRTSHKIRITTSVVWCVEQLMFDSSDFSEVPLAKSSISRKETGKPCQISIDLAFANNSGNDFDTLLFQNYYTSSITIIQQVSSGFVNILENYCLMNDPYCENKSQDWFAINISEFNGSFVRGKPMRIIMFQPASQWHKFELRNIKLLYKVPGMGSPTKNPQTSTTATTNNTSNSNNNKNTPQSIFDMMSLDLKIIREASRNQANNRSSTVYDTSYYVGAMDKNKSNKKKDKTKAVKRNSLVSSAISGAAAGNNTNSTD